MIRALYILGLGERLDVSIDYYLWSGADSYLVMRKVRQQEWAPLDSLSAG